MYSIIKKVIDRGEYDLNSIMAKVNTLWAEGSLDDGQREELIASARGGADNRNSVDVLAKLEELDRRVKALEDGNTEQSEEVPAFVVGKWYYAGDVCTFDGVKYTCIAPDGVVCVWSPVDYPAYWQGG